MQQEIDKLIFAFSDKLAKDLNDSLNKALKDGGSNNPQEAALHFEPRLKITTSGTTIEIVASGDYWRYVENGRKAGKMPPPNKLGKKWQNKNNINAPEIIYKMQVEYFQKKRLKRNVKKLKFDKAAKQLSFLIARSIGKKGVKPRPFIDRVINDGRLAMLGEGLSLIFKREISIQLNDIK